MSINVKFLRVRCITQQDWSGSDDLILILKDPVQKGGGILPTTSQFNLGTYSSGTTRSINLEMILCDDNDTLTFYEDDVFGRDLLGQINLRGHALGYGITHTLTGNGANYEVDMDILLGGEEICNIAE